MTLAPDAQRPARRAIAGGLGFAFGAAALLLAMVIFWGGPFAPQQPASVTLGEIAAEAGKAAFRSALGVEQPAPEPQASDIDAWLRTIVAALGGLAIVLGLGAMVRREPSQPAVCAATLGTGAILFQLFTWMVLVIAGAVVLVALLQSVESLADAIGSVFEAIGSFFGGLFGG